MENRALCWMNLQTVDRFAPRLVGFDFVSSVLTVICLLWGMSCNVNCCNCYSVVEDPSERIDDDIVERDLEEPLGSHSVDVATTSTSSLGLKDFTRRKSNPENTSNNGQYCSTVLIVVTLNLGLMKDREIPVDSWNQRMNCARCCSWQSPVGKSSNSLLLSTIRGET